MTKHPRTTIRVGGASSNLKAGSQTGEFCPQMPESGPAFLSVLFLFGGTPGEVACSEKLLIAWYTRACVCGWVFAAK